MSGTQFLQRRNPVDTSQGGQNTSEYLVHQDLCLPGLSRIIMEHNLPNTELLPSPLFSNFSFFGGTGG
jgi:hypothetical protein